MSLTESTTLLDEALSKISIGLLVSYWLQKPIRSTIESKGMRNLCFPTSTDLQREEYFLADSAPSFLILDNFIINEMLGGFTSVIGGKTLQIAWPPAPKDPPFIFVVGDYGPFSLFTNDLRRVEWMAIVPAKYSSIGHYLEMLSLKHVHVKSLIKQLEQSQEELIQTQNELVERLARSIEARDQTTGSHVRRMQDYAKVLAEKCQKVDRSEFILLAQATALHDIGKIAIKDCILTKPGKFTDLEFAIMKTHAEEGAKILDPCGDEPSDPYKKIMPLLKKSCEVAASHHERWDGKGYPNGLSGENIPLWGRIVAIVDVFDAMVSPRPYKPGIPFDKVMEAIAKGGVNGQFDPELAKYFVDSREEILALYNRFVADEANH